MGLRENGRECACLTCVRKIIITLGKVHSVNGQNTRHSTDKRHDTQRTQRTKDPSYRGAHADDDVVPDAAGVDDGVGAHAHVVADVGAVVARNLCHVHLKEEDDEKDEKNAK